MQWRNYISSIIKICNFIPTSEKYYEFNPISDNNNGWLDYEGDERTENIVKGMS